MVVYLFVGWLQRLHFCIFIFRSTDIDECAEGTDNCASVAGSSCEDSVGSFSCTCGAGFVAQTTAQGNQICVSECLHSESFSVWFGHVVSFVKVKLNCALANARTAAQSSSFVFLVGG